nr:uncharacterized protein LOC129265622 [Lytechinus pictus]
MDMMERKDKRDKEECGSLKSKCSSTRTGVSLAVSVELEMLELKKKAAAMQAKLSFKEKEKKVKEMERKAKMAQEAYEEMQDALVCEIELAENEAKLEVLEEFGKENGLEKSSLLEGLDINKEADMERFLKSCEADVTPPPNLVAGQSPQNFQVPSTQQSGWEHIAKSLERCVTQLGNVSLQQCAANQELLASLQLPKIDIPIFNGDPMTYPMWKHAFISMIDSKPMGSTTKLMYLNNYVTGKPKDVVQHFMLIGSEDGYERVMSVISERYGNPSIVSTAYMNKLAAWPKIGPKDCNGLMEFADFLGKVKAAKQSVKSPGILDYPQENAKLLEKLPVYLEGRWRDEIDRQRENIDQQEYPSFSKFEEFVRRAANKANIPELAGLRETSRSLGALGPKARTFATDGRRVKSEWSKNGSYAKCPWCKEDHTLDECDDFVTKPMYDRKAFFKRRLCMGCGRTDSHRIKECQDRRSCKECGGSHLSCLHYATKKTEHAGFVNCTTVCSIQDQNGRDHSMIVPVWVRHQENPSKECLVYAVLDDQSNVSFMSEKLRDKLGVKGASTNLQLTTMHGSSNIESKKIKGLEIQDYNKEHVIQLPVAFARQEIPASRSQIPKKEVVNHWPHLRQVADEMIPYDRNIDVSLFIGNDYPRAIRPRQVITGGEDDPYAQKSLLGWGIIGKVCLTSESSGAVVWNKATSCESVKFAVPSTAKEILCPQKVIAILEKDFADENMGGQSISMEDKKFLRIMEKGIRKRPDGHYEMPLPLKTPNTSLPYDRKVAENRWKQLNARFRRNPKFMEDYIEFMKDVLETCAERAPSSYKQGKVNYVPHTGVYHPKKPGKIRVVFDCSAKCEGISLNDNLLQGPDLTNGLVGVLCRFRQEEVAVVGDIKGMFHQFFVSEEDRDLLRFLWWEDGDPNKNVIEYRMKVHLFGATSSPGCANYGFKKAADDGEAEFGSDAASYIRDDFYVDDRLKSVATPDEAVSVMKASQAICSKAGLRLHKMMSNNKEVLQSFPIEDRAKGIADLDLEVDPLPIERALGVFWCVESDTLQFRIELKDRPLTRRGVLSTVGSIYDPIGLASPVTLRGKHILQDLCRRKLDWDSPLPDDVRPQWEKWRFEISELEKLNVPRCYKPPNFGKVKRTELHHFSDASFDGYGQCSYIRLVNEEDKVCCSLVTAKSRVTPLRQMTIPRLELTAATVSAKMSTFLRKELTVAKPQEFFWTDSQVVLGYIRNEARRFHVFVANRVQQIHDETNPKRWFYVNTEDNTADEASRGMTAKELVESSR